MTTPNFDIGPPSDPKDSRFLEWLALFWKYVKAGIKTEASAGIIAQQVFDRHVVQIPFQAPGQDIVGAAPNIIANNIYGRHVTVRPFEAPGQDISAQQNNILANQIFGS